jgi:hypothetical protein
MTYVAPADCCYIGRVSPTALRALLVSVGIVPFAAWSVVKLRRSPSVATGAQALGAFGLLLVVVAHICEGFRLLPQMGWGEPHSVGHYLDLLGAAIGLTLVPLGYLASRRGRAETSN